MRTEILGAKEIEFYDSIDDLPIKRFHKFNKYMLVDSGIGSDLSDIDSHISKIQAFIKNKDEKNAILQLQNMRQSMFLISEEINVKHLSFVTLIKSIDGEKLSDLSDYNVKRIHDELASESKDRIEKIVESIKKKVDEELDLYFPGHFNDSMVKEYYDNVEQKAAMQLQSIINDTDNNSSEIEEIDIFLLTLAKPKIFAGRKSIEITYEKKFEDMCLYLKSEMNADSDNMSTLQFYNAFEYIKSKKQ